MELNKLKSINGTYLYQDNSFNTFSITLDFLASPKNSSSPVLDVLTIYLTKCNQVYKTDDEINLRARELYDMTLYFTTIWEGKQKLLTLVADLISADAVGDDYLKEAFEFIRDIFKKPNFENEEILSIAKKKTISNMYSYLSNYDSYAVSLYNQMVLPVENMKYDYSVDQKYIEELVNSITLADLKREYNILINNYIGGLVFGNINEEHFCEFVKYMDLKSNINELDYSLNVETVEGNIEVTRECSESYIFVTYDFTALTFAEFRVLERMLNSSIGLCFRILREKYGLVYSSHANILFHEKKLYIYGEIDISKKQKFIEACDEIISYLKNKDIVEKYINQAKEEISNDEYLLSENKNRMRAIVNHRILKTYGNQDREIVNSEIDKMKSEEIMNKTLTLKRKNVFMVRSKDNE